MNNGKYVDVNGQEKSFTYGGVLPLSKQVNFIIEVAGMVVSDELGYMPILKNIYFNYCILKYYTDIVVFPDNNTFNLDVLDAFFRTNENLIDVIVDGIDKYEFMSLRDACDEAIEYRKVHIDKTDRLDNLMEALAKFLNVASEREIDMNVVNKLADIIPVMKDMGSVDVAKAIINEAHSDNKVVEMKKKRGISPKEEDEEIVKGLDRRVSSKEDVEKIIKGLDIV